VAIKIRGSLTPMRPTLYSFAFLPPELRAAPLEWNRTWRERRSWSSAVPRGHRWQVPAAAGLQAAHASAVPGGVRLNRRGPGRFRKREKSPFAAHSCVAWRSN
jgi:hypothetical protein